MWKVWYGVIPTDKAIKDGVGAKLRSCHTTVKKMNKKSANIKLPETADDGDNFTDQVVSRKEKDDDESSCSNSNMEGDQDSISDISDVEN